MPSPAAIQIIFNILCQNEMRKLDRLESILGSS